MPTGSSLARKAVKAAVLPGGIVNRRRSGDVVILLYHSVGAGGGEIDMPAGLFERQLAMLARRERVLTLDQAVAGSHDGGVVVTVDDGYRDFHDTVLPLLVAGESSAPGPAKALTWSQLGEAVGTGLVTVGAHTHGHVDLSRAPERLCQDEMARSKDLLEDRLGVACRHFAYPWAVASAAADRIARSLFETAALDTWRSNRAGAMDPWRLGRTPVLASDGLTFFRAKVQGRLDGEALAYRLLGRGPWRRS